LDVQVGHIALAATIASFAPQITAAAGVPRVKALSVESLVVVFLAHYLPNFDVIPIKLGWASDRFHCSYSHSLLFAVAVAALLWPFNPSWAVLALVSLVLHFVADSGSSVGLPLLLPFSRRRFSLYLWADTGHSGWFAFKSTYQQAWTWITEGGMFVLLAARFYQLRVWPFS
jgi:membrane-bound metal-dependent hydrolase YbcI (DUF457 family)